MVAATEIPLAAPETDVEEALRPASDRPWRTIVWNDPVNLMSYVAYVFRSYFGFSAEKANRLMLQVHTEGRSAVSTGTREQMEVDVQAMHSYGLWATLAQDGD
ncbi:ATP-dependent Clp protease adapter ClpS [Occultella glacieicola]|uniref:ATP-dependent Clp protease adapter protein ClpS n=1 Tax=Occultella glacieicola TaxID=2518684 RepID=A0ABY2E8C1_9MICO|nr:ATP-dependent Clp protease adapter ClpS [Occultella glacieicola]TDE97376.1 ATP-dependent Clp protease adapter ClpS [Occultella glacieicola]